MEGKNITKNFLNFHQYPVETIEFSSNETDSLIEMPLPSCSHDSENSARTQIFPLDHLKRPQFSRSLVSSFIENSLNSSMTLSSNWPEKIFCKQRNGGNNIVNEIRKKAGNSYLARKKNYIERLKKRYSQTMTSPISEPFKP